MKKITRRWIATFAATLLPLSAQTRIDLAREAKSADLSSIGATKPAQTGSVLPAACRQGEVFFLTSAPAGTNLTVCASDNHWTSAGGGSISTQASGTSVGTTTALNLLPGTYITQTVSCAGGTCSYQPDVDTTRIATNAAIQAGQLLAVISTSSSASAYTGVMAANDPLAAYVANQQLVWNVGSAACSGGPMTLNIDGLGAVPLKQSDGISNLSAVQCPSNSQLAITYDSVNRVFRGQSAPAAAGVNSVTGDGALLTNVASGGAVTLALGNAGPHRWFGNSGGTTGVPGFNVLTAGDIPILNQNTTGTAGSLSGGTTGQIYTATAGFIDLPDVKIVPFANCTGGAAASAASTAASNFTAACRAGSNNLGGADQAIPSTGASLQFLFELPGDWDTANQPYIDIYFGSGTNTAGTVAWTASSGCIDVSTNGAASDDPPFTTEPSFGTHTMSAANRLWTTAGQFTGMTSANGCKPYSPVIVKLALSGTAGSNINAYQAVVTIPRLPVAGAK